MEKGATHINTDTNNNNKDMDSWQSWAATVRVLVQVQAPIPCSREVYWGRCAESRERLADENGFEAGRRHNFRFEPKVEARKNTILLELHNIAVASRIGEAKVRIVDLYIRVARDPTSMTSTPW